MRQVYLYTSPAAPVFLPGRTKETHTMEEGKSADVLATDLNLREAVKGIRSGEWNLEDYAVQLQRRHNDTYMKYSHAILFSPYPQAAPTAGLGDSEPKSDQENAATTFKEIL